MTDLELLNLERLLVKALDDSLSARKVGPGKRAATDVNRALDAVRTEIEARHPLDLGNKIAQEGCDRCVCGCKYWENDRCIDCGTHITDTPRQER